MYDICIIGAGVVGSAIARTLSRYDVNVLWLEKHHDISCETTKANSGIIHGGYNAKHGTVKGDLCVRGNELYTQLNKELNFGLKRIGSLVVGFSEEDLVTLKDIQENGLKNGVKTELLNREQIKEIEPNIADGVLYALRCTKAGIVCPYEVAIALAENAVMNGVELKLNSEVHQIEHTEKGFKILFNDTYEEARVVVNAAGLFADNIARMVGIEDFDIKARRGQYLLFEKEEGYKANSVIFQVPKNNTKGVLVTKTLHGNLLIGPSAEFVQDKLDVDTTAEIIKDVTKKGENSIKEINLRKLIRTFSGNRATVEGGDFVIEESKIKNFILVAGIDSPGLTAAPAIAEKTIEIIKNTGIEMVEKEDFNPNRKGYTIYDDLSPEEIQSLIEKDARYGQMICRCEKVSEGQIVETLESVIPATTVDGVKKRVRAGMGKCQGGFCMPRVMKCISKYQNRPYETVDKADKGSFIINGRTKVALEEGK